MSTHRKAKHAVKDAGPFRLYSPHMSSCGKYHVRIVDTRKKPKEPERVTIRSTRETRFADALNKRDHWAEEIRREYQEGGPRDRLSFEEAANRWLEAKKASTREVTWAEYERILRSALFPRIGSKLLDTIIPADIEKAINAGQRGRSTRRMRRAVLYGVFRWAQRNRLYIKENPVVLVDVPRMPRKEKWALSHDEAALLVKLSFEAWTQSCTGTRNGGGHAAWTQQFTPARTLPLCLVLQLRQGLRISNALGLRWRNVRFDKQLLTFDGEAMKSKRSFAMPLHGDTLHLLNAELQYQGRIDPDARVLADLPEDGTTFRRLLGRLAARLAGQFNDPARQAEIRRLHPHLLRHTFASHVAELVPQAVAAALLDHAPTSVMGISGTYVHVSPQKTAEALSLLPSVLGQARSEKTAALS